LNESCNEWINRIARIWIDVMSTYDDSSHIGIARDLPNSCHRRND
jgi:hypothetical protein